VCRIFLSFLTLGNTSSYFFTISQTDLFHNYLALHFKTLEFHLKLTNVTEKHVFSQQRCKEPIRCNKFRLLIFLNQPYILRATNSPILRSTFDCIYSFWYNATTLLPTSNAFEMYLESHLNGVTGRQQCLCIVPKAVYTVKSVPEDVRICRPKHVGPIQVDQ
jgi:hypothetical protein